LVKKCPSEKFLNRLDFFAASRRIVALFNEEQRKNTTISMALQRTFFNQTASNNSVRLKGEGFNLTNGK
jgi:hypothetical protein